MPREGLLECFLPKASTWPYHARGMRRSYESSSGLLADVLGFLSEIFPGFDESERLARHHGLCWESCSTPFVLEHHGEIVSHVGLLEMTFAVDGVERRYGGIHAVGTRHDQRRRGHARKLLDEAISYGLERYEGLMLFAGVPSIYEGVGFEVVQEHRFTCLSPPPCGHDGADFFMAQGSALLDRLRSGSPIAIARSSRC